jgi:hypothetical protein
MSEQFEDVTAVVRDPLRFKYKLDIGEDAYESLRLKKYLLDAIDAGNGAVVGFGAAKSSLVASTFFAPSGLLGAIGVSSAATPLGWAVAAGVIGAGLSLAIGKHLVRGSSSQVRAVPDCINTPMDVLAVGLFDLIGLLGVKLALVDGDFLEVERDRLQEYFEQEWGYDGAFVSAGLDELERVADDHTIRKVAEQLANFKKQNPDCNYSTMTTEILAFLKDLSVVDGVVDEREELAIEKVEAVFAEVDRLKVQAMFNDTIGAVRGVGKKTAESARVTAVTAVSKVSDAARSVLRKNADSSDDKGPDKSEQE